MSRGWLKRALCVGISASLLCSPVAVRGDDPASGAPPATQKQIDALNDLLSGGDLIGAYAILMYFFIRQSINLKNLFSQVPEAIRSGRDLFTFPQHRTAYHTLRNQVEGLYKAQPELFLHLQRASYTHHDRLQELQQHLQQLKPEALSENPAWRRDLENALWTWEKEKDFSRLSEFFDRYGGDKDFRERIGERWLRDYEGALQAEERAARELALTANRITSAMNDRLEYVNRLPQLGLAAAGHRHNPGSFYHLGSTPGFLRIDSEGLIPHMQERCELGFKHLNGRLGELRSKGAWYAPFSAGGRMLAPVITVGAAGIPLGLMGLAYHYSMKKYGKDPSAAQREIQHQGRVTEELAVAAEASFTGQEAIRYEELNPFYDVVVEGILRSREGILEELRKMAAAHPEWKIDLAEKEAALNSRETLRYQVRQAVPFAKDSIARDLNFDQFLAFLDRAPKRPESSLVTKQFLNALYGRMARDLLYEVPPQQGAESLFLGQVPYSFDALKLQDFPVKNPALHPAVPTAR